jgi:hypothetical protein
MHLAVTVEAVASCVTVALAPDMALGVDRLTYPL